MKRLILVRHAKSDWPEDTDDFDRPLADRGLRDAPKMARHLKESGIQIDKLVTSPARRAATTAKFFNEEYKIELQEDQQLYHPQEQSFLSVIISLDNDLETVALFSHNNGISNFANSMSEDIFHFPTCGVAGFDADCDSWDAFEEAEKKLVFFYEPKNI